MKAKKTIGFRPEKEQGAVFLNTVDALGVTESELARKAFEIGFEPAVKSLAERKRSGANAVLKGLKSFVGARDQSHELELLAA